MRKEDRLIDPPRHRSCRVDQLRRVWVVSRDPDRLERSQVETCKGAASPSHSNTGCEMIKRVDSLMEGS